MKILCIGAHNDEIMFNLGGGALPQVRFATTAPEDGAEAILAHITVG